MRLRNFFLRKQYITNQSSILRKQNTAFLSSIQHLVSAKAAQSHSKTGHSYCSLIRGLSWFPKLEVILKTKIMTALTKNDYFLRFHLLCFFLPSRITLYTQENVSSIQQEACTTALKPNEWTLFMLLFGFLHRISRFFCNSSLQCSISRESNVCSALTFGCCRVIAGNCATMAF